MHWSGRIFITAAAALSAACASNQQVAQHDPTPSPASQLMVLEIAEPEEPAFITRAQMADDILLRAMAQIGTPYRWGGSTPQTGFDCSGLIGYVFANSMGFKLPRSTREMIQVKAPVIERNQLRTGDIVFFATKGGSRVDHAGIYVGDNRFVHAPSSGGRVRIDSLDTPYWKKAYLQAKRYLPEQLASSNG